ncbi:MAG: class I SAM-dependent methyltransferase [Sulfobacillus sp.]
MQGFLEYFPLVEMSRDEFAHRFVVTYARPVNLVEIFDLHPADRRPLIKNATDLRYINRERIVDYFYDVVVRNRHKYLSSFYRSFFHFDDPRSLRWSTAIAGIEVAPGQISLQKNDRSRNIVRNLFHLEILHHTRITNTCKSWTSFWETLDLVFNRLTLPDRFFAPSSIGLFLREKNNRESNYNNLFYLFQQYQPKASILNPYTMAWVMEHLLAPEPDDGRGLGWGLGLRLFSPVLSWGSYLIAIMHSNRWKEFVGVDVMPTVCKKVEFLAQFYRQLSPEFDKHTEIFCQPSEELAKSAGFRKRFERHFDAVLMCPPYWTFEIYHEGRQSVKSYGTYRQWLQGYWEPTVELCRHVLKPGGKFAFIVNDFHDLQRNEFHLIQDLNDIAKKYFQPVGSWLLVNRKSPLRMNFKNRTEQLCLYRNQS